MCTIAREGPDRGTWSHGIVPKMKARIRLLVRLAKWAGLAIGGLLAVSCCLIVLMIVLVMAGAGINLSSNTEVTRQKPYIDFIGREYRVVGEARAYAWNDFPDKAKILEITLMGPPGVANRFVSYSRPLKQGKRVRIVCAWRQLIFFGFSRHYIVSLPGAELPDDIPIQMNVEADGMPDPRLFEAVDK